MMGMAGGAEEGDQVVFGGVLTRPSSASTTGRSNTWEVKPVCLLVCLFVCLCLVCKLDGDLHSCLCFSAHGSPHAFRILA
jgi:hypothetical protein